MYIIGDDLLSQFTKVAVKNKSIQDGQHLETLAFLLGYSDNDNHIATDLVFPKQHGQAHKVDDEGILILYCFIALKLIDRYTYQNQKIFHMSKMVLLNRY